MNFNRHCLKRKDTNLTGWMSVMLFIYIFMLISSHPLEPNPLLNFLSWDLFCLYVFSIILCPLLFISLLEKVLISPVNWFTYKCSCLFWLMGWTLGVAKYIRCFILASSSLVTTFTTKFWYGGRKLLFF